MSFPGTRVFAILLIVFLIGWATRLADAQAPDQAEAAPPAPNPATVLSPQDRQNFLERLEELGVKRRQMRGQQFRDAINKLRALLTSPTDSVNFYEESVRELQFTGQEDRMGSEYRDWIDKNRDLHRDQDFRAALRFHLRYLMLTLQFLGTPPEAQGQLVQPLVDYVKDLSEADEEVFMGPGNREFLERPLSRSVFVRKLQLQDELGKLGTWEQEPGNLGGIEEVTLLPLLRRVAPDRVLDLWDFKISRETQVARNAQLAVDAANFQNLRLPTLQWQRAQDMLTYGDPRAAFQEMYRIVESYPNHPSFPQWVETIRRYLTPPTTSATEPAEETTDATEG